jgi:hypothetical protein
LLVLLQVELAMPVVAVLLLVVPLVVVPALATAALEGVGLMPVVGQELAPVAAVAAVTVVVALLLAVLPPAATVAKSDTAPAEDCVPLSAPPEVLTQTSLSVSGLCQKLGATSITT